MANNSKKMFSGLPKGLGERRFKMGFSTSHYPPETSDTRNSGKDFTTEAIVPNMAGLCV